MQSALTASPSNGDSRDSAIDLTNSRSPSPHPSLVEAAMLATTSTSHKRARSACSADIKPNTSAHSSTASARPFKVIVKPLKPEAAVDARKKNTLQPKASGAKIYPPASPTKYPRRIAEPVHLSSPIPANSTYLYKDHLEALDTDGASEDSEVVPILCSPRRSAKAQGKQRATEGFARVDRTGALVLSPPKEAPIVKRQYFVPPSPDSPQASTSALQDSDSEYTPRPSRRSPGIEVVVPRVTVHPRITFTTKAPKAEKRKRGRPPKVKPVQEDGKSLYARKYVPRGPRVKQSEEKPFHRGIWKTGRPPPPEVEAQFSIDISPPPPTAKKLIIKLKNPSLPSSLAKSEPVAPVPEPEFTFDSATPDSAEEVQGCNDPFLTYEPGLDPDVYEYAQQQQQQYTPPLSASLQTTFEDQPLAPCQPNEWFDEVPSLVQDEVPALVRDSPEAEDTEEVWTPTSDGLEGLEDLFGLHDRGLKASEDDWAFGLDGLGMEQDFGLML